MSTMTTSLLSPSRCPCIDKSFATKKVSFDMDKNKENENKQYKDEVYELWYSSQDYKTFRAQTSKIAQAVAKSTVTSLNRTSYQTAITRTYLACCEAVQGTEDILTPCESNTLMMCVDSNRLGMDKYAVKTVTKHRSERRSVLQSAVFAAQKGKAKCGLLRATSEYISLASRLYARTMAVALAADIENKEKRSFNTIALYSSLRSAARRTASAA
jgi:hypothetical protein